ncbi:MAG: hypothetical protein Q4A71_06250 [Actinomycetaceae bacterium]|nr:hypothetical protein [Actinomycetaceae bacterium]
MSFRGSNPVLNVPQFLNFREGETLVSFLGNKAVRELGQSGVLASGQVPRQPFLLRAQVGVNRSVLIQPGMGLVGRDSVAPHQEVMGSGWSGAESRPFPSAGGPGGPRHRREAGARKKRGWGKWLLLVLVVLLVLAGVGVFALNSFMRQSVQQGIGEYFEKNARNVVVSGPDGFTLAQHFVGKFRRITVQGDDLKVNEIGGKMSHFQIVMDGASPRTQSVDHIEMSADADFMETVMQQGAGNNAIKFEDGAMVSEQDIPGLGKMRMVIRPEVVNDGGQLGMASRLARLEVPNPLVKAAVPFKEGDVMQTVSGDKICRAPVPHLTSLQLDGSKVHFVCEGRNVSMEGMGGFGGK